jgi:hypothetical protein
LLVADRWTMAAALATSPPRRRGEEVIGHITFRQACRRLAGPIASNRTPAVTLSLSEHGVQASRVLNKGKPFDSKNRVGKLRLAWP